MNPEEDWDWAGGNDLAALEAAHARCHAIIGWPYTPPFYRERCLELLQATTIQEYEQTRANWDELAVALGGVLGVSGIAEHPEPIKVAPRRKRDVKKAIPD